MGESDSGLTPTESLAGLLPVGPSGSPEGLGISTFPGMEAEGPDADMVSDLEKENARSTLFFCTRRRRARSEQTLRVTMTKGLQMKLHYQYAHDMEVSTVLKGNCITVI